MINPGKYTAKIKDYGIGSTKAGEPKAMILFTFKDQNGAEKELTWSGSLKEGRAREITIDALLTCGLKGEDLSSFADGVESNSLDANTEVSITIDNEEYEGKTFSRINWINKLGGAMFRNKLDSADATKKLAGLNLKGDILARRKETGIKDKETLPF